MSIDKNTEQQIVPPVEYEGILTHHINDAVAEAARRNIEVNCVLINQSLAYSKQIPPIADGTGIICLIRPADMQLSPSNQWTISQSVVAAGPQSGTV